MKMRVEKWCGNYIHFIEHNGEWWADLEDICDALDLRVEEIVGRLDPEMMIRVPQPSLDTITTAVNELGIYEALFASQKLESHKFRRWSATVMKRLRNKVGLEGYEVMKMTEPDIQGEIDNILDTLFYDEESGKLMQSVTIQGGDVDQVPFEDD